MLFINLPLDQNILYLGMQHKLWDILMWIIEIIWYETVSQQEWEKKTFLEEVQNNLYLSSVMAMGAIENGLIPIVEGLWLVDWRKNKNKNKMPFGLTKWY